MSSAVSASSPDGLPESDSTPVTTTRRPGRWRAIVMAIVLIAFWAYILALPWMEMLMFHRFITRMAALLALLLVTVGLWLSNSRFSWRDRFVVFLGTIGLLFAASRVTDKSVDAFGLLLGGFPWIATGGALWLLMTSQRPPGTRRNGLIGLAMLVFGVLTLVRWEGLDGAQRSIYAWRWSPSSEEQFRAERAAAAAPASMTLADWTDKPGDWTSFRGGECEGIVEGVPPLDWSTAPPQLVWKQRIGPAWSSVLIVDGFLVTQEQRADAEAIVCYEADSGKQVWAYESVGRFEEGLSGAGPRATPTYHRGKIYACGARGRLTCLHAKDGSLAWTRDVREEASAEIPMWGYSSSPLIVDELVVVFAGGESKSLMAYHAEDGNPAWAAAGGKITFSSPQLMTLSGVRQIVMHDNRALYAVNPEDGKLLWEQVGSNPMFQPMLQPHRMTADELIVEADGGIERLQVVEADGKWTLSSKWKSNRLKASFNDIFIHKDHIYGLDDGILCCLDAATGKRLWKKGRYGYGQLLLVPDHDQLVVLTDKGEGVVVAASPKGHQELGSFPAIEGKTWNHPVIAHGRLYVRNAAEIASFDLGQAH